METPILARAVVVEEAIDPIPCRVRIAGSGEVPLDAWLVASPEASMKRLLAAGSGPIWQLGRAFRDGERGAKHLPEFAILEWYRPGFDHHTLMREVGELLAALLDGFVSVPAPATVTYRELFVERAGIDPHAAAPAELRRAAERLGVAIPAGLDPADRDGWLDLILVAALEPSLGVPAPLFIHDYPASQAALARVRREEPGGALVGERFELYFRGLELANGYHELADAAEQERRFETANRRRVALGRPPLPLDRALLAALAAGIPSCAGVAIGFDRVVMLACGAERIDDVIAFPPAE